MVDIPASFKPVRFPFPNSFLQDVRDDPNKLPAGLVPGLLAPDRNRRDEYSGQWNISIQQALTKTLAFQAAYVGNRALKLYQGALLNPIDGKTGIRPHAEIGPAWLQENAGRSWHHGLQVSVRQRMTQGLTLDAYYTYSKTMDYAKDDDTGDVFFSRPYKAFNYGPADFDQTHIFTINYIWDVPGLGRRFDNRFVKTVFDVRTGQPLNITVGRDVVGNGQGGPQRPDVTPGTDQRLYTADRLVWLNPGAYDVTGVTRDKRFGNLGFDTGRGPGAFSWDLAIHKIFAIREQQRLMFRFEMFNWLNHFVPGNPSVTLTDPNFGRITGAAANTTARNIQFALKYTF